MKKLFFILMLISPSAGAVVIRTAVVVSSGALQAGTTMGMNISSGTVINLNSSIFTSTNGFRNFLSYPGADNTGSVDVSTALRSYISNLSSSGSEIIIPSGNYLIMTTVTINNMNNVVIRGQGKSTKLFTNATSGVHIFDIEKSSSVKIRDIYFYGNANGFGDSDVEGIRISSSNYTEISGCFFENLNYLINVNGGSLLSTNPSGTNIHDNNFLSSYGVSSGGYGVHHAYAQGTRIHHNVFAPGPFGRHAIYFSVGSRNSTADHNYAEGAIGAIISHNSGTSGTRIWGVTIDANTLVGPGASVANAYGIVATGGIDNSNIINNSIDDAGNTAILVQSASASIYPTAISISGNNISDSYGSGIELGDAMATKITNNILSGNGLDNSSNDISVRNINTVSSGCVVSDNISRSSMRYMVSFGAGTIDESAYRNTSRTMNSSFGIYNDLGTNNYIPKVEDPNLTRYTLFISSLTTIASSTGTLAFDSSWRLYVATGTTAQRQWVRIGSQ